jgi:SAM-dependent methyltransferase
MLSRQSTGKVTLAIACTALALGAAPLAAQASAAEAPPQIGQASRNSVWVPTPQRVIRRMLQLADVTSQDVVMDLGSGDGRIPIYAARHFGARGIGVELEDNLVRLSLEAARAQGVSARVRFIHGDLFEADLSQATVIALYVSPGVMTRLKPRLLALKPGTRVVSHHFTLDDWEPDETIRTEDRNGYLWVVPADFRGTWTVKTGADRLIVHVEQVYQRLSARAERAGRAVPVVGVRARGTEIRFTTFDADGGTRNYVGNVAAGRMSGNSEGHNVRPRPWSAVRD